MTVVPIERGIGHAPGDAARKLFQGWAILGLWPPTPSMLLTVPRARNKRGGQ
jgi:hypothetical protein